MRSTGKPASHSPSSPDLKRRLRPKASLLANVPIRRLASAFIRLAWRLSALPTLVFFLVAPAMPAVEQSTRSPLKATLLLEHSQPSPWNNLLCQGLEKAARDFGVTTNVVIAEPGPNQREIFREAARNSDLVLVASDNLHEILRDNAANFRRVMFGSIDAGIRAPNIMSITFADEQAAFLAGAAAAIATRAKKTRHAKDTAIGWLSGQDTPAMRSLFNGFSEGAKLTDPGIRVIQALVDSFTDPTAAAARAEWLANSGAGIIALAAGAGNPGAVAQLANRGLLKIDLDVLSGEPLTMAAITKAADRAVYEIVAAATSKFRGKEIIVYDLANGGVNLAGLENFARQNQVSPDLIRRVGELRRELEQGSIKLRSLRARTLCDCLD